MKQISIPEYGRIPVSDLTPDELRRLRVFDETRGPGSTPVFDWRFRQYVRSRNMVGVVQVPGLQVEILPKIDDRGGSAGHFEEYDPQRRMAQGNLLFMLGYTQDLRMMDVDLSSLRLKDMSLLDTVVAVFATRLGHELKRGLDHGYVHQEDCLPVLRGKLLFSRQVQQSAVNAAMFHVQYDEYIPDTWLNRILKAACMLLVRAVGSTWLRKCLQDILENLSPVTDHRISPEHFKLIRWSRNNERFRPYVDFASLVLAGQSPAPARGRVQTFSLLFPMDDLFEEFVGRFLLRHASQIGLQRDLIRLQAVGHRRWLLRDKDQRGKFRLKPDVLLLGSGGGVAGIIDTKWKRLSPDEPKQGVSQSDLYQLYAYARRYDCPRSTLLYPMGKGLVECDWSLDGDPSKTVSVRLLDLGFEFADNKGWMLGEFRRVFGYSCGD